MGVFGWCGSPNLVTRKSACKPSLFRKVRVVRPRWSIRRVNLAVNYGTAQLGGGWRLSAGTPPTLFPTTVGPDQVGPPRAEPALPVVSSPSYPPNPPSNDSKIECVGVGEGVRGKTTQCEGVARVCVCWVPKLLGDGFLTAFQHCRRTPPFPRLSWLGASLSMVAERSEPEPISLSLQSSKNRLTGNREQQPPFSRVVETETNGRPRDMVAEEVGSFGNQKVDLPPHTRGPKGPSKFCGVCEEPLLDPFSANVGVGKPTRGSPPLADGQASIFEATSCERTGSRL